MPEFVTVCNVDDLAIGAPSSFIIDQIPVAIFRTNDGIFALDDRCPHAGASLARGYMADNVIHCRIHHWGFDIHSGRNIDSSTPCRDARMIDVRVFENQVQVRIPKERTQTLLHE